MIWGLADCKALCLTEEIKFHLLERMCRIALGIQSIYSMIISILCRVSFLKKHDIR